MALYNVGDAGIVGDFSESYNAGGLDYGDNGAEVGTFGGVIGRMINNLNGTTANNIFNAKQAALARQHDLYMSSTAYQRAAADMRAAGINPATLTGLSSGSASSASGSGSSTASAATGSGGVIGSLLKAAVGLAVLAK